MTHPPINWTIKKLGDICFTTSGGTPNRKRTDFYNGSIPWVKSGELVGGIITRTEESITDEALQNSSAKVFPCGTLLIALYGATIGKLAFLGIEAATNQAVCGIYKCAALNQKYLYYFLSLQRPALIKLGIGGAQPNISQTILKDIPIPYPPLPEQERIVARIEELFSDLDKGVEALQTIKAQLKVYRQAVLKEAFDPKSGWVLKTSAEIGEVNLGRQRSPKNVSNNYPTKYIRAANITEQGLNLSDLLEMEFTPSERQKYTLVQGDIVLSEASGSIRQVGKPAIWKNEIEGCCFQNTVIRHRVNGANPQYVFWYYKYCYVSGLFSKIVGGVGINHIGAKNFSELVVPLAPREEQNRIVAEIESRLSVCDKIEQTVDESLAKAESLRQSIFKKAFEGRL